ncbi:MAG: ATP-binding cassette domain-containing protein, partial [Actinobacteria bacterium]|nr:ATP-binding cassette domain-containing protein [Actinomycetota bacterium]
MTILELKDLCCYFGGLKAVEKFNTKIIKGELVGLIGPNGAGKTTIFNVITGIYPPTSGEIFCQEVNIGGLPSHKITQKGIVRTFQNIRIFPALTVLDNIIIAYHFRTHYSIFSGI